MSLNSVTSTKTSIKSPPMFHSTPTEKVIVPGIGIASKSPEGVLEVVYQDGSRLALRPPDLGGGITFTQMNGSTCHYNTTSDEYTLPDVVRNRLNQMEIVVKYLMFHNNPPVPCTPVSNKCIQQQMKFFR